MFPLNTRYAPIDFSDKLALLSQHWSPRVVAEMNDYQFKLVKLQGAFVWHRHADTDEVFIVLDGNMTIEFRDGVVALSAGQMHVVPKGSNTARRRSTNAACCWSSRAVWSIPAMRVAHTPQTTTSGFECCATRAGARRPIRRLVAEPLPRARNDALQRNVHHCAGIDGCAAMTQRNSA